MQVRSFSRFVLCGIAVTTLLTGCATAPPENAVTWGIKAGTGQLTQATPIEWQAVAEKIDVRLPNVDVALSDAQAAAVVEFVQLNELDTIDSIVELAEQVQRDPQVAEQIEIPEGMIELFVDVEIDVDVLIADLLADMWI